MRRLRRALRLSLRWGYGGGRQVLCIVEAMKLLNEIESDVAGEIVKKMGSNGQPIEYGQSCSRSDRRSEGDWVIL